ncbi:aldo/keto reductase [Bifidobacterium subtile]|jgi:aryl-alcohol dehydrogenase-like predicted oxidoreductase|uniref:Oxidoreductase n=1 Tax=Bifidobacterium subtile TaxID=77635 RepID=A0A087E5N7_9BIFI|nr:aldo/keto reductase [Bifidobacterium subtile]KFJ03088.1 oxidoreductase [Bifidobacterium subtile]MCI1222424.1 aldo/keto reductase [Bifidobacterium subtile]MCI1240998.1 aldo/keto reductase [Bifidobacterium subtile]MCI1257906.1 aldo/keto reductase [Bifidobacterium subtile]
MSTQRMNVGSSDLEVFPLALGGNTFGWTSDETASREVLDGYVAAGGNFIDTADVYSAWVEGNAGGESETILGRWLAVRGNRDKVVVATKVSQHPQYSGLSAANIAAAADASLLRLGTDYIDLYYAHFDDESTPLEETVEAFDKLVRSGKVRAIGLSNYTASRIEEWFRIAREGGYALPVALEPHYNLVVRINYETNLLPVARRENLAVFPYYSLASGFLTGKYRSSADAEGKARQGDVAPYLNDKGYALIDVLDAIAKAHRVSIATVSLAWLLKRPQVTAPIASARTAEQLPALISATRLSLSDEEMNALDTASAPLMR